MKRQDDAAVRSSHGCDSATVAGKDLVVNELRVKYLVLDGGGYSIIDRSNHIVDSGDSGGRRFEDDGQVLDVEQRRHASWNSPNTRKKMARTAC